jgi:cytochrome P450
VLSAVIDEALRLHPAAPASLPRETPAGGRLLNGYTIPHKVKTTALPTHAGANKYQTTVSAQCYTTQRDSVAFHDPNEYLPERWLGTKEVLTEVKTLFMPFSSGPRACLGKNLAMMELKVITATLIRRFHIRSASTTTEASMAMIDHFLVIPKGGKCDLIFDHRPV